MVGTKVVLQSMDTVDCNGSADTTYYIFNAPRAGKIHVEECWVTYEEAVGSQDTTAAAVSIEVATVEVGALTCTDSAAIGDTQSFTVTSTLGTTANGRGVINFAADDAIELIGKTQSVGTTVTGEARGYLTLEFA